MENKPTHEQAQLHLQVYDLRREPRLREARDWFQQNYRAETLEDAMKLAAPGTEHGTFLGMVMGYWEQACALLNYGLLHEDLFFETSGEFFGVWEQLKNVAPQFREAFKSPNLLTNLEKAANRFEEWNNKRNPGHIDAMRQWMKQEQAKAKALAEERDDAVGIPEPRDDPAHLHPAGVHGAAEFAGERWNVVDVDEHGDRHAPGRRSPLDHEVAFGEEQPGAGIVAFLGAARQPALVQSELPEQRILRVVDRNDLERAAGHVCVGISEGRCTEILTQTGNEGIGGGLRSRVSGLGGQ